MLSRQLDGPSMLIINILCCFVLFFGDLKYNNSNNIIFCETKHIMQMDVKRKASEGIVAIPAKKSKNELALRYGARNDYDENVSREHGGV